MEQGRYTREPPPYGVLRMSHYKKCIMFYRAMTHGDLNVLVPLLPILAYWLKVKNNDDNLISAVYDAASLHLRMPVITAAPSAAASLVRAAPGDEAPSDQTRIVTAAPGDEAPLLDEFVMPFTSPAPEVPVRGDVTDDLHDTCDVGQPLFWRLTNQGLKNRPIQNLLVVAGHRRRFSEQNHIQQQTAKHRRSGVTVPVTPLPKETSHEARHVILSALRHAAPSSEDLAKVTAATYFSRQQLRIVTYCDPMSNAAPRTVLENDSAADVERFDNFYKQCFEYESTEVDVAKAMRNEQLTGPEYISVAWKLITLLRLLDHRVQAPSVRRRLGHVTLPHRTFATCTSRSVAVLCCAWLQAYDKTEERYSIKRIVRGVLASLPLVDDWESITVGDVVRISPDVNDLSDLQAIDPSSLVKDVPAGNPLMASMFPCLMSMFKKRASNKHKLWTPPANFDEDDNADELEIIAYCYERDDDWEPASIGRSYKLKSNSPTIIIPQVRHTRPTAA